MCDWTDCPGQEASGTDANMTTPNPQSNHASTSGGAQTNCERFSNFVDDDELAALSKGVVPAGTDKCTRWALANFAAWKKARNEKHPEDPVPEDIFTCNDPATLNTHFSRFVVETRKSNGDFYPPKTLHQLLCGLLRQHTKSCTFQTKLSQCSRVLNLVNTALYMFWTCTSASCHKKPSSKTFSLFDHLKMYLMILPNHGIAVCQLVRTYLTPNWVKCVHLQELKEE